MKDRMDRGLDRELQALPNTAVMLATLGAIALGGLAGAHWFARDGRAAPHETPSARDVAAPAPAVVDVTAPASTVVGAAAADAPADVAARAPSTPPPAAHAPRPAAASTPALPDGRAGLDEALPVSRRQLAAVRAALGEPR